MPSIRLKPKSVSARSIGEILLDSGDITNEQLEAALKVQSESGGSLGDILISQNSATQDQVKKAFAIQAGMEAVELRTITIPDEVIAKIDRMMAEVYRIIPCEWIQSENTLVVAMADPSNLHALDDLRFMLNCNVRGAVASEIEIANALDRYYGKTKQDDSIDSVIDGISEDDFKVIAEGDDAIDTEAIKDAANSVPVVKLLNLVLLSAIRDQSSDIHFEPFENSFRIRYRVDGALLELKSPPRGLAMPLISRIKVLANLNIAERRVPQDGKIPLSLAGRTVDLRVSTLPTMFGESVVIRVLDRSVVALDINRLGMRQEDLEQFQELIHKPNGIVLVTGPTGSGKTTTLYSCLNAVNEITDKIITTEDPVEYDLQGIIQCPINSDIGVTYAACLRAILRQDPDIILVGEIRDQETGGIAIEAALTGHLVFSTLHTQDAPGTIARLVEMGLEPYLLAATIEAVIAQRLVRVICPTCRQNYLPPEEELYELGLRPEDCVHRQFFYGQGCEMCKKTGYKGRNALYEIMRMNSVLRDLIIGRRSTEVLRNAAMQSGMHPLRDAGILKIFDGITTIEEVVRETMALE